MGQGGGARVLHSGSRVLVPRLVQQGNEDPEPPLGQSDPSPGAAGLVDGEEWTQADRRKRHQRCAPGESVQTGLAPGISAIPLHTNILQRSQEAAASVHSYDKSHQTGEATEAGLAQPAGPHICNCSLRRSGGRARRGSGVQLVPKDGRQMDPRRYSSVETSHKESVRESNDHTVQPQDSG